MYMMSEVASLLSSSSSAIIRKRRTEKVSGDLEVLLTKVAISTSFKGGNVGLQDLLNKPQPLFALVLSPTRELAIQIAEQAEALGAGIALRTAVLVGGINMMDQALHLGKRPHIVVGTPGRVVDHLSNTKAIPISAAL